MRYVYALVGAGFMVLATFYGFLLRSSQTQIHPSLGAFGAVLTVVTVFTFGVYLLLRESSRRPLARVAAASRIAACGSLAALTLSAGFGSHFSTADRVVLLLVGAVLGAVTVLLVRAGLR
jgi:peptidoglycan/LPS O-acetylase OafA/YrhL